MNIVFDLDGTLIDSAPDIQSAASAVLKGYGKDGLTLEETRSYIGQGAAVFVSRAMAARDIVDDPCSHSLFYEKFIVRYQSAVDKAVFYPGALTALTALKASGYRLGLCTNKPVLPTQAVLRHMGIESLFDALMAGGMIDSHKPEPDMLLRTIHDLGGGPTLFVGDSETDAETAKRAAIPFALYSQGYRKVAVSELHHDWVFDDYESFPGIVGEAVERSKGL